MNLKGTLPLLVLQVLASRPAHGYEIAKTIKRRSASVLDFQEGGLYPCLHGLEKQGLIDSYEGLEQGRKRRYYKLTRNGLEELQREKAEWARLCGAVRLVLEGT